MRVIDYVDRLLKHWAQEMNTANSSVSLGYRSGWMSGAISEGGGVRVKALTARGTATRPGPRVHDIGRVAERVDLAVNALPEHLKRVVQVHYLERPGDTIVSKAMAVGCSRKTFYKNIHRAQNELKDDLPDSYVNFTVRYPHCG